MRSIFIALFLLPLLASAQQGRLLAEGNAPKLFVSHTIAPKESYYSVGRLYNISPKEIAPFNGTSMEKGFNIGQVIKVPLTTANFSQTNSAAADEALVPVYHTVKDKEGLYRISMAYNKVPVQSLKQWNNLADENLSTGTQLIVGYLKVKKDLSALANGAVTVAATTTVKAEPKKTEKKEPVKTEPVVKEEKTKVTETVIVETPVKAKEDVKPATNNGNIDYNGGSFKKTYSKEDDGNNVKESGAAATFKSTSGWEDGKYYCLHNSAAQGSILKITNNANGKSIYAKVLDVIPDIKQNSGLLVRISNAAATELGVGDAKFDCTINYAK